MAFYCVGRPEVPLLTRGEYADRGNDISARTMGSVLLHFPVEILNTPPSSGTLFAVEQRRISASRRLATGTDNTVTDAEIADNVVDGPGKPASGSLPAPWVQQNI